MPVRSLSEGPGEPQEDEERRPKPPQDEPAPPPSPAEVNAQRQPAIAQNRYSVEDYAGLDISSAITDIIGATANYVSPVTQAISEVERATASSLPTRVVMELAGLPITDREKALVAKRLTHDLTVPPRYLFGDTDPRNYVNPVTGEPMSMQEARRYAGSFTPVVIASMIQDATTTTRARRGGGSDTRDAGSIGQLASALTDIYGDLPASVGISLAVALYDRGVTKRKLLSSAEAVRTYMESIGAPDRPEVFVSLAAAGAAKGNVRTAQDVVRALFGADAAKAAEEVQALIERRDLLADPAASAAAIKAGDQSLVYNPGGSKIGAEKRINTITMQYGDAFAQIAPDLWADVQAIQEDVRFRDEAFGRSIVGKAFNGVGRAFDQTWEWTEQGLVQLGTGLVAVGTAGIGTAGEALGIYDDGKTAAALDNLGRINNYAFQRIASGDTVGDLVTEGFGLPSWASPIFDFGVGWYVDPFVVAGKFAQFRRAARVIPDLNQARLLRLAVENKVPVVGGPLKAKRVADAEQSLRRFQRYVSTTLPKSTLADKIFEAAYEGNTKYLRSLDRLYGTYQSRGVMDWEYMKLVRDRLLLRYPSKTKEARQAFGEALTAHFIGYGPAGSVAEEAVKGRLTRAMAADKVGLDAVARMDPAKVEVNLGREFVDDGTGIFVPSTTPTEIVEQVIREQTGGWHVPFSPEAPSSGWIADIGPRRLGRRVTTSQFLTRTSGGRRGARLISMNPGRLMNLESAADEYTLLHARRWGMFTEQQNRVYQSRIIEIENAGKAVEAKKAALIDEINMAGMAAYAERQNIGPEALDDLQEAILGPTRKQNMREEMFGVAEGKGITRPMFESQLKNHIVVIDPIDALREMRQYVSMRRRFFNTFRRSVGANLPEVTKMLGNPTAIRTWEKTLQFGRAYRRTWKAYTVARPAYVPRVILGDENARFLATTQSLSERLLSQKLGPLGRSLDARGVFDETFEIGDEVITVKRPGAFDYEPMAAGKVREQELLTEALKHADDLHKAQTHGVVSWGIVKAAEGRKQHVDAWSWVLTKQFRNSTPGRIALESVAGGDSVAGTTRKILAWAKEDKYVTLRSRIGRDIDDAPEWADQLSRMAHGYTLGNADIATMAMNGNNRALRDALEKIDLKNRPDVHGPSVADHLTTAEQGIATRFADTMYSWWVRQPEDVLNRQPFYKTWKRRAERGYLQMLQDAGMAEVKQVDPGLFPGRTTRTLPDYPFGQDAPLQAARATVGDAEGFVYHITPQKNFDSIRATGLEPRVTHHVPIEMVPPEMREGRLFFAESQERARQLAHGTDNFVTYRVKASVVGDTHPEQLFSGSQYGFKGVDPEDLEFLGRDKAWHPVVQQGGITPEIRQQIDVASREFALGQVKRIMFDFTRQSRFTELLSVVFPFPQPFFEGFQAWSHIAWRNPEAIGRGMTLYRMAVDSGLIETDPVSGELVVGMGVYKTGARVMNALGLGSEHFDKGLRFVSGLASFNMLASTTIKMPSDGILGRLVGGMPVPVPGLDPAAGRLLQHIFAGTTNPSLSSWLFQYGPSTPILPSTVAAVLAQWSPELVDQISGQKFLDRYALALEEFYQVHDLVPKGMSSEDVARMARADAVELYQTQKLLSILSPASLRVQFGTEGLQQEWQELLESSDSWDAANEEWAKRHPDLTLIPLSRTFYADPDATDAKGTPVQAGFGPGKSAPRVPASELVSLLYAHPTIGNFMRMNPEWAALALIGADQDLLEAQDFSVYASQLADGFVAYKDPQRFWEEGENAKAWAEVDAFYKGNWNVWTDVMERKGLDEQDDFYQTMIARRQETFLGIALEHPDFARRYFAEVTDPDNPEGDPIGYEWKDGGDDVPAAIIVRDARRIAATPGFAHFPGFIALNDYLEGRDKIARAMKEAGVRTLDPESTTAEPFFRRYESLVNGLIKDAPQFEPFLTQYFGIQREGNTLISTDDLMDLPSDRVVFRHRLMRTEQGQQRLDKADALDAQIERLRDKAFSLEGLSEGSERSQLYLDAQRLMDNAPPKVVDTWWKLQGQRVRDDYMQSLITKPAVFYSNHDWELAGVKLTKNAREWLDAMAQARVDIARQEEEDPVGYSEADGYGAIDAFVRQHIGQDESFKAAVDAINDWGHPIVLGGYEDLPGKAGKLWTEFRKTLRQTQDAVDRVGWLGVNYGDEASRTAWADGQKALKEIVESYRRNPGFRSTWDALQEQYGDFLIGNVFLPDDYFKLGGTD